MTKHRQQAEQTIGESLEAAACFITPGSSPFGVSIGGMLYRLSNLRSEQPSGTTAGRNQIRDHHGHVYVVATSSELVIFELCPQLFSYSIGTQLFRCELSKAKMSYNKKTEVRIEISDGQGFFLTTQDAPERTSELVEHVTEHGQSAG